MDSILQWAEQYQTEIAVAGGVVVLLLVGWAIWRAVRSRRGERTVERPTDTVRRPIYADHQLLDELRAHGTPATDRGEPGAGTPRRPESPSGTGGDGTRSTGSEDTRRLNETLTALEGSPVLVDLDADPDAELRPGKAVVLSGTLQRHPATDAAEILALSAPLLQRASGNGHGHGPSGDGDTTTLTQARAEEVSTESAPVVVRLEHPATKRDFLLVLPRRHLLVDDPIRGDRRVTVVAVVEKVLGRRETVEVDEYLAPHLSEQGRSMLAEQDLTELITGLSDVTHENLGARDLPFKGPGALLSPAAIHH